MSVATELTRIIGLKAELLDNLDTMGVALDPEATLEEMVDAVLTISTGDGAFVPGAFTSGDWTATADVGEIDLNITALPSDGGTAITELQYRLDGGSAVALSGTGTGARTISGLTPGVEYDVEIRAVNVLGAGAWSDIKSRTPTSATTAPDAFEVGDWTATAGDTEVVLNITALPDDGGSAITALEYRLDGGSAVALSGTGTGERTITGLTNDTEYDIEIRAVNAVGNGAWSDLKARTPVASGDTFIRMSALTDMSETGDGTTGWIYTGDASNAVAAGSDYTLAAGVAGGLEVQCNKPGTANPLVGWYTAPTGGIVDDYHMLAYEFSGDWVVVDSAFSDIVTTPRLYEAGDHLRIRFDTGNGITVEIARAATPTTWLALASASLTRSVTLYPKLGSLSADGAVLTAPKVSV